jgi:hypothetical protein
MERFKRGCKAAATLVKLEWDLNVRTGRQSGIHGARMAEVWKKNFFFITNYTERYTYLDETKCKVGQLQRKSGTLNKTRINIFLNSWLYFLLKLVNYFLRWDRKILSSISSHVTPNCIIVLYSITSLCTTHTRYNLAPWCHSQLSCSTSYPRYSAINLS